MTSETNQNFELLKNAEIIREAFPGDNNDSFLLLNNKLKIVSFNSSASNFFSQHMQKGLQAGKIFFEQLSEIQFAPLKQMIEKAKEGISLQREILVTNSLGNELWMRFTVSPSFNKKREIIGVACIGCNVHKEKTQEAKINMQGIVLKEIAQMYSHQVRHPLTNIMAIINLILCDDFTMTKKYLGYLETASKELDHVIRNVVLVSSQAA